MAVTLLVAGLVFMIWGSVDAQEWAMPKVSKPRDTRAQYHTECLQSSLSASTVTSDVAIDAIDKLVVGGGLNPRFSAR